jgi:hypothetical protein
MYTPGSTSDSIMLDFEIAINPVTSLAQILAHYTSYNGQSLVVYGYERCSMTYIVPVTDITSISLVSLNGNISAGSKLTIERGY